MQASVICMFKNMGEKQAVFFEPHILVLQCSKSTSFGNKHADLSNEATNYKNFIVACCTFFGIFFAG